MPTDMKVWRKLVKDSVRAISDEKMQRRAWFGIGPEVSSPTEEYCQFFDGAAIEEYLAHSDSGLDINAHNKGQYLIDLMNQLSAKVPTHIKPEDLIDDPRWIKIREAAKEFLTTL